MFINPKHQTTAVSICATNYLGKSLVLLESYQKHHPDSDFYILLIDRKDEAITNRFPGINLLWVEDLGIEQFRHFAFKFDIIELSTNVKPTILRLLLEHYAKVLYLDPDIGVFSPFTPVFENLERHSIVVTPHALTPVLDGSNPSDVDFSRFGSFNLGFVGVSQCPEAFGFLDWWSERCLKLGYYEPQVGLAVDQKWIDLAPCYFPNLKILREPGLNVAFWNLHERNLSFKHGQGFVNDTHPLYFYHFSSFSLDDPQSIAHKQSRFPKGTRPDVYPLMENYAQELARKDERELSSRAYSFDFFDDGTYITPMLRRVYAALESRFPAGENPFDPASALYRFARGKGLCGPAIAPAKRHTFKDMEKFSGAARTIQTGLRWVLRVVGPNRYFSLMKYLAYISSIRNQAGLFTDLGKEH